MSIIRAGRASLLVAILGIVSTACATTAPAATPTPAPPTAATTPTATAAPTAISTPTTAPTAGPTVAPTSTTPPTVPPTKAPTVTASPAPTATTPPTVPPTTAPTATASPAPTATPTDGPDPTIDPWSLNPIEHREAIGEHFEYDCSPNGSPYTIWGTDVYTDDSSVCTAAVHAGLITFAQGGQVTIEMRPGQDAYVSSERNGVVSSDYGSWGGSYVFVTN